MTGADFSTLAELLKPGQVLTNPVELLTYEVDAANDRGLPQGVVFPNSVEDVALIVKWAAQNGVPVIARGAGTGLSGGAVADRGGLILEFSRMNRIVEFDPEGRSVVVEPGVVNLHLDEAVKKAGLYFPPDPSSGRTATIGGNLAENAGGPHCFKYGVTTNYVNGMEVILADGSPVRFGGRALDYPEYDFAGVMIGSEGTLGIITQAGFHLLRNPPAVMTMMAAFETVEAAGNAVSAMIARGLVPATMELMDQKIMVIIEDYAHAGLPVQAGAALIVEVDGQRESLDAQMGEVLATIREHTSLEIRVAQTAEERDRIWHGRKSAAGAMARLAPAYHLLDGSVPRSRLAQTLAAINHVCDELELRVGYVFHAGDGNLHPFILIEDPSDAGLLERVHQAGDEVMAICLGHNGSITGEHGVGIEKRKYMTKMYGPAELSAMREVKAVFDPQEILNPGKIFPEGAASQSDLPPALDLRSAWLEPVSTEEAAETIRAYAAAGQALTIRGAGGLSSTPARGEVLSTRGLSGIRQMALEDLYVTAGAGTPLSGLQEALSQHGMWIPLVPAWPEATLGGLLATNFNAPLRMRYGALRDLLLAATVVLPDGRIVRLGRPVVKNVAGYDLQKLFVGAHGTLGLITEVTLKLAAEPRRRASLLAPIENLATGLDWARRLLPACLTASALLVCRQAPGLPAAPYTLIYTSEGVEQDVDTELVEARKILEQAGADGVQQVDGLSGSRVWAEWIQAGELPGGLARLGVGVRDLPELMREQADILEADASFVADLANGLLYLRGPVVLSALREAARRRGGYAIQMNGGISPALEPWGYEPDSLELMRKLKRKWDPAGKLNPGEFIV